MLLYWVGFNRVEATALKATVLHAAVEPAVTQNENSSGKSVHHRIGHDRALTGKDVRLPDLVSMKPSFHRCPPSLE